jgi:tetratricopeptide (TPR) repeat protein
VEADAGEEIRQALGTGDVLTAYRHFLRATSGRTPFTLDEGTIMQLGNSLLLAGRHGPAVHVYEVMLSAYPASEEASEAAFRLGTVLSRGLEEYDRARPWLVHAVETHPNPLRKEQALDELRRVDAHLRMGFLSRRPRE